MATGSDVADDDQIRLQLGKAFGGPAFKDVDTGATEVVGHRRVDARVGAHDLMTQGTHQQGGVTHRRAADAHEINAHGADKSPRGAKGEKLRQGDLPKQEDPGRLAAAGVQYLPLTILAWLSLSVT